MINKSLQRILILDDDADLRKLLLVHLGKMFPGVELEEYDPVSRGIPAQDFDWSRYDVLILDYHLSIDRITGLDVLQANCKKPAFPAVIMLTGTGTEEIAVRALKSGAYDYLRKQSLDKKTLQSSISNAFEKHQAEKLRLSELTRQGHAFNKAVFYQKLEYQQGDSEHRPRALFLIELDDHAVIEEHAGIILRDNIVRHIAKQGYEVFKQANINPSITRLSDHYIAVLIDATESSPASESVATALIQHLDKSPYRFGNTEFGYTVSIGVVILPGDGQSADKIIRNAKLACKIAGYEKCNSFHIYRDDEGEETPVTQKPPEQHAGPLPADSSAIISATRQGPPEAETTPAPSAKPVPTSASTAVNNTVPVVENQQDRPEPEVNQSGQNAKSVSPKTGDISNTTEIETNERLLMLAFKEKSVIQLYQPVISLLNEEIENDDEMYRVYLQQINKDGSVKTGEEVRLQVNSPEFRKFVDRWTLQEIIGRLTNSENNRYTFIIDISDASLADAGFFNWLRKLLTGLESKTPGRNIVFEINIADLARLEKQANALITYLRKSHEFKFMLGGVTDSGEIIKYTNRIKFDLVRCSHTIVEKLVETGMESTGGTEQPVIESIRLKGTRFIVDDIKDSSILTEAISFGIEYAMGDLIGEPTNQLSDVTNVETFEII